MSRHMCRAAAHVRLGESLSSSQGWIVYMHVHGMRSSSAVVGGWAAAHLKPGTSFSSG